MSQDPLSPLQGAEMQKDKPKFSLPILLVTLLFLAWAGVYGAFWVFHILFYPAIVPEHQGTLQTARGIVTVVVFSVIIVGSLLSVPSPLGALEDEWEDGTLFFDLSRREKYRLRFYSLWYIRMRWVAIISTAFLLLLSLGFLKWLPPEVAPPLLSILVFLVVFNLTLQRFLRKGRLPKHLLLVQVLADLFSLTAMLHFAGGLENPLVILLLFHVIIAGILLTPKECYLVAATASTLIGLMALAEWLGIAEHYTLAIVPHGHDHDMHASKDAGYASTMTAIYSTALFLAAYFTTKIMAQMRANEMRIHGMALEMIENQQILEESLETTRTAICVLGKKRKPKWKNRIWDSWFPKGLSPFPEAMEAEEQEFEDCKTRTLELERKGRGGEGGRWFRIQFAALKDPEKDIMQIVELASDITREKEEQVQMIRAEQLAAVGKLASHVAHEVNNPITVMGAKARLLLSKFQGELPEKVATDLKKIAELADRVADIAQGLLSYSRPSPKKKTRFDLRKVLRSSMELVRPKLAEKKAKGDLLLPDDPCWVEGNEGELGQVFLNLLVNAVDAIAEAGAVSIELKLETRCGQKGFGVKVRDSGSGIPSEILGKIFEPFFTTKDKHKGTGLGLSICFGIVKGHAGILTVESEVGKGATFLVWLPKT